MNDKSIVIRYDHQENKCASDKQLFIVEILLLLVHMSLNWSILLFNFFTFS